MNAIKEYNELINNSTNDRFTEWSNYRESLTSFIIDFIPKNTKSILVIGAGKSDDIDLFKISQYTEQLFLSDIDNISLKQAINNYNLSEKHVTLLVEEYTGLSSNESWNDFIGAFLKINDLKEINKLIDSFSIVISNNILLNKYKESFDFIIVSPIYTQLVFQQVMTNLTLLENLGYSKNLIEHIKNKFLELMPLIIENFNKNVIKLLKPTSSIIIISDIFETTYNSKFYNQLKPILNNKKQLNIFYLKYIKEYGFGFGDYGLNHIKESLKEIEEKWFEWPFSKQRKLFIKCVYFKKTI